MLLGQRPLPVLAEHELSPAVSTLDTAPDHSLPPEILFPKALHSPGSACSPLLHPSFSPSTRSLNVAVSSAFSDLSAWF